MVSGELVVVGAREFVYEPFKARCSLKINEFAAFDADEVVMMGVEGLSELVALFKADLNHVYDTELRKELQRAVDARALSELAGFDNLP